MNKKKKWLKIGIVAVALIISGFVYCFIHLGTKNNADMITYQLQTGNTGGSQVTGSVITNSDTTGDAVTFDEERTGAEETVSLMEGADSKTSVSEKMTDQTELTSIIVYVCGAVMTPGVYELKEESRVVDAIYAAGGLAVQNAAELINQAEKITDGQRIYIPYAEDLTALSEAEIAAGQSAVSQKTETVDNNKKVNINTAKEEELITLTGIGPSRAQSIIAYREENGFFEEPEDIMNVPGIKEAAYDKIKDDICTY